jgi:hypothetical protein
LNATALQGSLFEQIFDPNKFREWMVSSSLRSLTAEQLSTPFSLLSNSQIAGLFLSNPTDSQLNAINNSFPGFYSKWLSIEADTSVDIDDIQSDELWPGFIAAYKTGTVSSWSTAVITALTTDQVRELTFSQISALNSQQLANFTALQFGAIEAFDLPTITTQEWTAISTAQINSLTAESAQALRTAQVAALKTAQVAALSSGGVLLLASGQIPALSTATIVLLPDAFLSDDSQSHFLNEHQIVGFATNQLSPLSPEQFANLFPDPALLLKFSPDQMAVLSPANAAAAFDALVNENEYANELPAFGSKVSRLTTAQLQAFSSDQLARWDAWEWTFFSSQQISALSTSHIRALASDFSGPHTEPIKGLGLTTAQVSGLRTEHMAALSTAQISNFTPFQLQVLTSTQWNALSTAQVGALANDEADGLAPYQIEGLTTWQVRIF